jgi:CHASE2 domain-containing sensor protein
MTTTQQTKIAELLINKLKQAHKQAFEEILPPTVLQNQIEQKMVLAGVVYEMLRDAFNYSFLNDDDDDFDNYINNMK